MANGSGYGTAIGAGLGSVIPGLGTALGGGIGGLLGGLFGNGDNGMGEQDYWLRKQGQEYGATADKWFDPNNQFYTQSAQNQKQNLMDMYLAGNRERRKQLASQGINSQYMNNTMQKDAMSKSAEGANNFALQNYKQGLGVGQQFAQMAQNSMEQLTQLRQGQQQSSDSMSNNFMGIGAGLLGNVMGGGNDFSFFGGGNSGVPNDISSSFRQNAYNSGQRY